jgi:hypothetical protein
MNLLVAIEAHFCGKGDDVFSYNLTYDRFWHRHVRVFDKVRVVARVHSVEEAPRDLLQATGPGVSFHALPNYRGPRQYLRACGRVKKVVRQAIDDCDAVLLRVPGNVATVVWKELRRRH